MTIITAQLAASGPEQDSQRAHMAQTPTHSTFRALAPTSYHCLVL
jgi:hypothetical protein